MTLDWGTSVQMFRVGDPHGRRPMFELVFYGREARLLTCVGEGAGGDIVQAALRRRGLDPTEWWTSLWHVSVGREHGRSMGRRR